MKLSLLILHPVAARSWYLEGVTALSRKRSPLELIFPKNCHRSSPVEVQNSPKRFHSLRMEIPPVTLLQRKGVTQRKEGTFGPLLLFELFNCSHLTYSNSLKNSSANPVLMVCM